MAPASERHTICQPRPLALDSVDSSAPDGDQAQRLVGLQVFHLSGSESRSNGFFLFPRPTRARLYLRARDFPSGDHAKLKLRSVWFV